MGLTKSNIPYFDRNWSPVTGCSFGCPECYARAVANRFGKSFEPTFHPDRLGDPAKRKKPTTIGVCFHGDLFDPALTDGQFYLAMESMLAAPHHTYVLLTKRAYEIATTLCQHFCYGPQSNWFLGVTVRNQTELDAAAWHIRAMAGRGWKVWLSIEPIQGPVDLSAVADSLSGVILGGQSGPGAAWMSHRWVQVVHDQCAESEVPFMLKQWSDHRPRTVLENLQQHVLNGWPVLDGRTHTALAWPLHEKVLP